VVDLTPLIDVVFQLLIFFLLTSSYVSHQAPSMDVDQPESSLRADAKKLDDFTVAVHADGSLLVGDGERVSLEELAVRMARAKSDNPDTVVLIRGDQATAYGHIVEVMSLAKIAGLRISAVYRAAQ
jgi:biopolymer transport protein ExbD